MLLLLVTQTARVLVEEVTGVTGFGVWGSSWAR